MPDIVLAAIDADVSKIYVEAGLGVGIVADIAFDTTRDAGLVAIPTGHLFGAQTTYVAIKRDAARLAATRTTSSGASRRGPIEA